MASILAAATEAEWRDSLGFRDQYGDEPYVTEAASIASRHFASLESLGIIRLRESPYYRPELQLADFMSALGDLFTGGTEAPPG